MGVVFFIKEGFELFEWSGVVGFWVKGYHENNKKVLEQKS